MEEEKRMTRRVAVLVQCNMCGADLPEDHEKETIARNKQVREMDLCDRCRPKLDKAINVFLEIGTPPSKEEAKQNKKATGKSRAQHPTQCGKCKTWFPFPQAKGAHERSCKGTPPPHPCPDAKCKTAFTKATDLAKHIERGVHVIPPAQVRAA